MKNAIITFVLSILAAISLHAQEGEIIYTDYGPNGMTHEFGEELLFTPGYWHLDLNQDGVNDCYYMAVMDWDGDWDDCYNWIYTRFQVTNPTTDNIAFYYINDTITNPLQIGDTISNSNVDWRLTYYFPIPVYFFTGYEQVIRYMVFRFKKDDDFCYAWIEHDFEYVKTPFGDGGYMHKARVTIYRTAYCTVPNYPLRVGQTSFNWDDLEETTTAVFTLHPNPTNGQVTIIGKNLKQAEVFNALGQCVATAQGEGERLTVDISALPAGIYFVNVTDEDGKKCIRKVVKQ